MSTLPIINLRQPEDLSLRTANVIAIHGWIALNNSQNKVIPDIRATLAVVLRGLPFPTVDEQNASVVLRAGDKLHGIELRDLQISSIDIPVPGKESDLSLRAYEVTGELIVGAIIPEEDKQQKLQVSLRCSIDNLFIESNHAHFSLLPIGRWQDPRGGFLSPNLPCRIFANSFCFEGWAIRLADKLVEVTICLDSEPVGNAALNLPSPIVAATYPDVDYASNARFCFYVELDSLLKKIIRGKDSENRFALSAICKFASGETFTVSGPVVVWNPEFAYNINTPAFGAIETIKSFGPGDMCIEGWMVNPQLIDLNFFLEARTWRLRLSPPDMPRETVSWTFRDDISRDYFQLVQGRACGFSLVFNRGALGQAPGMVKVVVESVSGSFRLELGPQNLLRQLSDELTVKNLSFFSSSAIKSNLSYTLSSLGVRKQFESRLVDSQRRKAKFPRNILIASHNLSAVEGAPKVQYEIVKALRDKFDGELTFQVLSAHDGDLRTQYEELGLKVIVCSSLNVFGQTYDRYFDGLKNIVGILSIEPPDFVFANVVDSFWAIDYAYRYRIPNLWLIHESVNPLSIYSDLDWRLRQLFLDRLRKANWLGFVAKQTLNLFSPYIDTNKTSVIANGIDIKKIDQLRSQISVANAKAQLGVSSQEIVISIVGTTTYRKGQDVFLKEMASVKNDCPQNKFRFFVVGAREIDFLRQLEHLAYELNLTKEVTFVPETPDIVRYFIASDILVMASREESSPLVSLEAFAYGLPLVSTDVFGLADQLSHGKNALVFKLEEEGGLSSAVIKLIENPSLRTSLVLEGRKTVENLYSLQASIGRYEELISDIYGQTDTR